MPLVLSASLVLLLVLLGYVLVLLMFLPKT
jgi:hypothetical protein